MAEARSPTYLRRYTDLPALLYLLRTKTLTVLDPKSWDDRNDSYYLSLYKQRKKLKSVLALCFAEVPETYHHWRVFSQGSGGVCIVFNRRSLLDHVAMQPNTRTDKVEYLTLIEARKRTFLVQELPFLKRAGYRPEGEYRITHESATEELRSLGITIDLKCIRSISLSPWLHPALTDSTIASIRAVNGCEKLKVSRSTLTSNLQWMGFGDGALDNSSPQDIRR